MDYTHTHTNSLPLTNMFEANIKILDNKYTQINNFQVCPKNIYNGPGPKDEQSHPHCQQKSEPLTFLGLR